MMKNFTLVCLANRCITEKSDFGNLGFYGKELNVNTNGDLKSIFSPSKKSVKAILDFAKSYEVLHSRTVGCVEVNKN